MFSVVCPVGTYMSGSSGGCELCAIDTYQDKEGEVTCQQCPQGQVSTLGAYSLQQCKKLSYFQTEVLNKGLSYIVA